MKNFSWILPSLFAVTAQATSLTNEDLFKLVKAGLSEAAVFQAIDVSDQKFDLSAAGLVNLKVSGISNPIIQRVLARSAACSSPYQEARSGRTVACAPHGFHNRIALHSGDQVLFGELKRTTFVVENASAGRVFLTAATLGVAPVGSEVKVEVAGEGSALILSGRWPVFSGLVIPFGGEAEGVFSIVRLVSGAGKRSVSIARATSSMIAMSIDLGFSPESIVPVAVTSDFPSGTADPSQRVLYSVRPKNELDVGEYALVVGRDHFIDFAIR